jgi:regulator of RNase E activity RraA
MTLVAIDGARHWTIAYSRALLDRAASPTLKGVGICAAGAARDLTPHRRCDPPAFEVRKIRMLSHLMLQFWHR